jgi:predicted nucleic acid-binding Zn ribbon protein
LAAAAAAGVAIPASSRHNARMPPVCGRRAVEDMAKKQPTDAAPIGRILTPLLENLRPETAAGILDVWKVWAQAVGDEAARHAQPSGFKGQVLLVAVDSSTWLHHLHFQKSDLVARINRLLDRAVVGDIKFTIAAL